MPDRNYCYRGEGWKIITFKETGSSEGAGTRLSAAVSG